MSWPPYSTPPGKAMDKAVDSSAPLTHKDIMANRLNTLMGCVNRATLTVEARMAYERILEEQATRQGLVRITR